MADNGAHDRYVVGTFTDDRAAGRAVNALRLAGLPVGRIVQDTRRVRAVSAWGEMVEATSTARTIGTRGVLRNAFLGGVVGGVLGAALVGGGTALVAVAIGGEVAELTLWAVIAGGGSGSTVGALSGAGTGSILKRQGPARQAHVGDAREQLVADHAAIVGFHSEDDEQVALARKILEQSGPVRVDVASDLPYQVDAER